MILLDIISLYKSYVNRRLVAKEEMGRKKIRANLCLRKKILQTSGLKKIHAPKIFHPPPPHPPSVIFNGLSLNDLIFLFVQEIVTPKEDLESRRPAWSVMSLSK